MPTHGANRSSVELQVTDGSVQVEVTELKPLPVAAYPDQLPPSWLNPGARPCLPAWCRAKSTTRCPAGAGCAAAAVLEVRPLNAVAPAVSARAASSAGRMCLAPSWRGMARQYAQYGQSRTLFRY